MESTSVEKVVQRLEANGFTLLKDQVEAVQRMHDKLMSQADDGRLRTGSMLLNMDMGTGKTIMAIALMILQQERLQQQVHRYPKKWMGFRKYAVSLLVVPTNVLQQWKDVLVETAGFQEDQVLVFHNLKKGEKQLMLADLEAKSFKKDVFVLTSYELARKHIDVLKAMWPNIVLFDEVHRLSNPRTQNFKQLHQLAWQAYQRRYGQAASTPLYPDYHKPVTLSLSGTVITNHLMQLYAVMKVGVPQLFGIPKAFRAEYVDPIHKGMNSPPGSIARRCATRVLRKLNQITDPMTERMGKEDMDLEHMSGRDNSEIVDESDCLGLFASLSNAVVYVSPTEVQTECAQKIVEDGEGDVLGTIGRLRAVCAHPLLRLPKDRLLKKLDYVARNGDKVVSSSVREGTQVPLWEKFLVESSCKTRFALEVIKRSVPQKKVAIISEYKTVLTIFEIILGKYGIQSVRLDGDTKLSRRTDIQNVINDPQSDKHVLLMTRATGGEAIQLPGIQVAVQVDSWWTPTTQTVARFYRIGQMKNAMYLQPLACGMPEEVMFKVSTTKGQVKRMVTEGKSWTRFFSHSEMNQLLTVRDGPMSSVCSSLDKFLGQNRSKTECTNSKERRRVAFYEETRKLALACGALAANDVLALDKCRPGADSYKEKLSDLQGTTECCSSSFARTITTFGEKSGLSEIHSDRPLGIASNAEKASALRFRRPRHLLHAGNKRQAEEQLPMIRHDRVAC